MENLELKGSTQNFDNTENQNETKNDEFESLNYDVENMIPRIFAQYVKLGDDTNNIPWIVVLWLKYTGIQ